VTPEDIARRYSIRPGYELVDYSAVALPLYRLTVDAVTMAHREIPPIKTFVMRSIAAGLGELHEVAGFLGLDEATVDGTFSQLQDDGYAALSASGSTAVLLDRGREVLAKERESSPQDEMLVFLYDRLLRKPVRLGAEQLLLPASIDPQRTIEIRAYPADGPDITDLSLPDILQVLEQQAGGRASFGRDLLRFKRIVRRVRVYRPAVGLVYKKTRGPDVQVTFIVDDARHEGLEHAFAECGGPKKMGFLKSIDESVAAGELRRQLGSEVHRLLPNAAALEEKRVKASLARIKHQSALARAERRKGMGASDAIEAKEVISITSAALAQAEEELKAFPARPILPFELAELLDEAIELSQTFFAVSSRDAGLHVVDLFFLERLEVALQRGVETVISLSEPGIGSGPVLELERLRRRHSNLFLIEGRRSASYHLVSDHRFAAVCNRPLLCNQDRVRMYHHVVGYLLQTPELVAAFTRRLEIRTGKLPDRPRERSHRIERQV